MESTGKEKSLVNCVDLAIAGDRIRTMLEVFAEIDFDNDERPTTGMADAARKAIARWDSLFASNGA